MNFIGKWSSYEFNGYGSMEDTEIVFCPDGSGWCQFICAGGGELLTFSWHVVDDGKIKVGNKCYFIVNSDGSLEKEANDETEENEEYISVTSEAIPEGKETEVLTTSLSPGEKFALVSREMKPWKRAQ